MASRKPRAIQIGIVRNRSDKGDTLGLPTQYTISNKVYGEIAEALSKHGAEVVEIETGDNLFARLHSVAEGSDILFSLANDLLYQVAVPITLEQLHKELDQRYPICTGSGAEGHMLALNKVRARQVLSGRVSQPEWWCLDEHESPQPDTITFPVLVKPINEGESIGVDEANVVSSLGDLQRSLDQLRKRFGGPLLVESFLDGPEYSVGLIGNVVMPPVAWDLKKLPGQPLVRSENLKQADLTIPHAQIVRDPDLAESLARQAATAHIELGLQDYSRSDFRAKQGSAEPYYLETNSMPGLHSQQSVLPWSFTRAGVAYEDIIGSIVAQALRRLPEEHVQQLNTAGFEAAYSRLLDRASSGQRICVRGQEFYLLEPTD